MTRVVLSHEDALIALDALGVAIATVARASLTALACAGIQQYFCGGLRLRWSGYDEQHEIVLATDLALQVVWRSELSPHGPAWTGAEAASRLIELVDARSAAD